MMKKLFARIGSVVLVLLLLAGCSGQKSLEEQMAGSWYAEGREIEVLQQAFPTYKWNKTVVGGSV